jgi:hypothetical protein
MQHVVEGLNCLHQFTANAKLMKHFNNLLLRSRADYVFCDQPHRVVKTDIGLHGKVPLCFELHSNADLPHAGARRLHCRIREASNGGAISAAYTRMVTVR